MYSSEGSSPSGYTRIYQERVRLSRIRPGFKELPGDVGLSLSRKLYNT